MKKELTLNEFVHFVFRSKNQIIVSGLLSTIIGIVATFYIKPVYKSEVKVIMAVTEKANPLLAKLGGLANFVGPKLGMGSEGLERIDLIANSGNFIEKLVDEIKLKEILYPDMWDSKSNNWNDELKKPNEQQVLEDVRRTFKGEVDLEKNVYTIKSFVNTDTLSAQILNDYVDFLNVYLVRRNMNKIEDNLAYLYKKKKMVKDQLILNEVVASISSEFRNQAFVNKDIIEVIDSPLVPYKRHFPPKKIIVIATFIFGLVFGLIIAVIRLWWKNYKLEYDAK